MGLSDGYLTNSPEGNWRTSNVGGDSGEVSSPYATPTYVRLEHPEAPIPGAKVNGVGEISEGPSISFTDPSGLLSGAPAEDGNRPFIVWAGVSPLSLQEALLVWNTNIVLLSKSKITGGEVKSVSGRLMVVDLGSPIQITGLEQRMITVQAGAVGMYRAGGLEVDPCDEELEVPLTESEPGGELEPPEEPEPCDECGEVVFGDPEDPGEGGGGAQVQALVFSTICNPKAQCGDFQGNQASFIVNNPLNVPVRCTHPFYLEKCYTGFEECPCDRECKREAAVWEVAMELYGGTLPGEIFPLDNLQPINPCKVGLTNFSFGYPGTLIAPVACGDPDCPTAAVEIVGRFGPAVVLNDGVWEHGNPGYAGQQVIYLPPCYEVCDDSCVARVIPDLADCFVAEDIIKPVERTIPVSFFEDFKLTLQEFTIFDTTQIGLKETQITAYELTADQTVTQFENTIVALPDWTLGEPVTVSQYEATETPVVTNIATGMDSLVKVECKDPVNVVTDITSSSGSFVQSITPEILEVVTDMPEIATEKVVQELVTSDIPLEQLRVVVFGEARVSVPVYGIESDVSAISVNVPNFPDEMSEVTIITGFDSEFEAQLITDGILTTPLTQLNDVEAVNITSFTLGDATPVLTDITLLTDSVNIPVTGEAVEVGTALAFESKNVVSPGNVLVGGAMVTDTITRLAMVEGIDVVTNINTGMDLVTGVQVADSLNVVTEVTGHGVGIDLQITHVDVVTDLDYNQVSVVFDMQNSQVMLPNALNFGAAINLMAGASLSVVTGLDYITITACVGDTPTPIRVATDIKTSQLSTTNINIPESLSSGPVSLPIDPVKGTIEEASPKMGSAIGSLTEPEDTFLTAVTGLEDSISMFETMPPIEVITAITLQTDGITAVTEGTTLDIVTSVAFEVGPLSTETLQIPTDLNKTAITGVVPGDDVAFVTGFTPAKATITGVEEDKVVEVLAGTVGDVIGVVTDIPLSEEITVVGDPEEIVVPLTELHGFDVPPSEFWPMDYEPLRIIDDTDVTNLKVIQSLTHITVTGLDGEPTMGSITGISTSTLANAITTISLDKTPVSQVSCISDVDVVTSVKVTSGNVTGVREDGSVVVREIERLDDIEVTVIGTDFQTFNIPDFEEKLLNVVVEDDEAENQFVVMNPDSFEVYEALIPDEDGDITLLTSTDPGCDVTYKFLNHDGQIDWTNTETSPADCCEGQEASCTPLPLPHPVEANCEKFLLLRANYVTAPPSPTAELCPCYDCTPESCEEDGGGPFEIPGGGPNPCTIRVRRLNRRFCVNRDCNPGP